MQKEMKSGLAEGFRVTRLIAFITFGRGNKELPLPGDARSGHG